MGERDKTEPTAAMGREIDRLERSAMAWPLAPGEALLPAETSPSAGRRAAALALPGLGAGVDVAGIVRSAVETALLAALFTFGLRAVAQPRVVDGGSMEPTLHTGQRVLVSPLAFRILGQVERGQIVVFDALGQTEDYIKRIVGLPGDTVAIRHGQVIVNGSPVAEPYLAASATGDSAPVTLGPDEYYVLGDNRPDSADSRYYGPVPADRIIGPAFLRFWPPADVGPIGP